MTALQTLHNTARGVAPRRWHEMLLGSVGALSRGGDPSMPGFPADEVQQSLNGRSAAQSMGQAFEIYSIAIQAYLAHGRPRPDARFLDFGAGWGRIWRYFIRDFEPANMLAFDVTPSLAAFWSEAMLGARIDIGREFEPLPYDDGSVDLVLSNSVFSHLSEPLNLHSAREINRILGPGGIFVGTTFGPWHMRQWKSWKASAAPLAGRRKMLANLTDFDAAIAAYERGEFIFLPTGQTGRSENFEITAFSDRWIARHWPGLEVIAFDDKRAGQAVFVVRRPAPAAA